MNATTQDRVIFALRTTLAALLAAFVAFLVDLPQASTSLITVMIVAQPFAGMALSKSVYRVLGTAAGAAVAVAMTAVFNAEPAFFAVAVSAWIGLCVAVSTLLRDAPAAYGALLSGYTVALIAFPNVDAPNDVFLAALDRSAEITVGILCATTLSQTFFPKSAADALRAATSGAVASATRWAEETLSGRLDAQKQADRRSLITRVVRLESLRVQASYDSAAVRIANRRIRLLHGRIVGFIALLVSIHDRLTILRGERPDLIARLEPPLEAAARVMADGASVADRRACAAALREQAPSMDAIRDDRSKLLERTVFLRTADLVELRGELDPDVAAASDGESLARYRDYTLAAVSGFAAFAALIATLAFWIATGWNAGAGAAIMVAVMTSLFAQQDDPGASAGAFFVMTALGTAVAAGYLFAVLPRLEGFEELAACLAPTLFATAYVMSGRRALAGLAFAIGLLSMLGLSNVTPTDFASFANSGAATLFGIGVAAVLLRVLRPIGAAWPIARLTAGLQGELAKAFAGRRPPPRLVFESRMLDRIDGLMARLDPTNARQLKLEQGALAGLRVGLNGLALRKVVRDLPASVAGPVASALAELARHFRRLSRGEVSAPPLDRLDFALDAALAADLTNGNPVAETPVWIAALATSLTNYPDLFGHAEDERAPAATIREVL